jgi:hypothetical protein
VATEGRTTDADRLERAMGIAGLSAGELAQLYVQSETPPPRPFAMDLRLDRILAGELGRILAGELGLADGVLIARLACLLDCDSRWLATGRPSPAAEAAIAAVTRAATPAAWRQDVLRQCCEVLEMTPQSAPATGVCCYCGCTDDQVCPGGCGWVDVNHTICSACLDPEMAHQ